eukprot:g61814.t1
MRNAKTKATCSSKRDQSSPAFIVTDKKNHSNYCTVVYVAGDIRRTRRSTISLKVVKVVSACCVLQLRAIDA